jgi:hypothetical protein
MTVACRDRFPWPLWPVAALLDLAAFALRFTARAVMVVCGFAAMIVGAIATATIVGAPLGVPLFALGLLLAVRGIF